MEKRDKGLGVIARIQCSDGKDQLYGDRNEKDGTGREVAVAVGGLDIVGKK